MTGTRFAWDFGGGAVPNTLVTSTARTPTVVLGKPGTYTAKVIADGAETRATYTVRPFDVSPTAVPGYVYSSGENAFSIVPLPNGEDVLVRCQRSGVFPFLQMVVRSGTTFATYPITTGEGTCGLPQAKLGPDGRIHLVTHDTTSGRRLLYYVSRDARPRGPADWQSRVVLASNAVSSIRPILTFRSDGRPVIGYHVGGLGRALVATSPTPSEPAHWVASGPGAFGSPFGLALLGDRPAFLFRSDERADPNNGVRVALAKTTEPRGDADYVLMTLPRPAVASAFGGRDPSLTVLDGRLVAVFRELGGLRLARARIAVPQTGADFDLSDIEPAGAAPVPQWQSAAMTTTSFQGRLALGYETTAGGVQRRRFAVARAAAPAQPADWEIVDVGPATLQSYTIAGKGRELLLGYVEPATRATTTWAVAR